jgi:hypothetical protein
LSKLVKKVIRRKKNYQPARRGNAPRRCSRRGISTASWPAPAGTLALAPNSGQTSAKSARTHARTNTPAELDRPQVESPYLELRVAHPLEQNLGADLAASSDRAAEGGVQTAPGGGGKAGAEGGGPAPPEEKRQLLRRHGHGDLAARL